MNGRIPNAAAAAAVFLAVLGAQLALVAACGTDIPFHDQWNIEGQWLYPAWRDGTLTFGGLLQAFNEHRILWTHLLNLGIFAANGQWDPLVQLVAIAVLRAACAAGLAWVVARELSPRGRVAVAAVVAVAFLPHLAWHNVLWGIESHAYFALGCSLIALRLLGAEDPSPRRIAAGVAVTIAGLFAMGPAALVPVALLGLAMVRAIERRRMAWKDAGVAGLLLALALILRVTVPEHAALQASGPGEFLAAAGRVLGWPHAQTPLVALGVNAPLLLLLGLRLARKRTAAHGEDFVVLLAGWSAAIALATAWARGGSAELAAGLPSRYVDFIVLLPLANVWAAAALAREVAAPRRPLGVLVAGAWGAFLLAGWIGLSAEVWRGLVLPRARDREAPVRLMQAYQASRDDAVFAGQPLLLVPHPNLAAVRAVLDDPRMKGALPPSLQPEQLPGPLSRAARAVVAR
ncbi:MAG: hypothetical protein JNL39_19565 [Opitutaceae bacterium]|nr:hypothetical protein [Opitutaceae bacterium]